MTPFLSTPSGAPAASAGEFVLDDGLDEDADEDMLAFQSTRTAAAEAVEAAALTPPHRPAAQNNASKPRPRPASPAKPPPAGDAPLRVPIPALALALGPAAEKELELCGLPVGCTRGDLDGLFGPGALLAIRLGAAENGVYGPSTVRVRAESAARALQSGDSQVRGKVIVITERGAGAKIADALRDAGEKLPIAEIAQAAKRAQQDAANALKEWDAKYALSARAGAAGAAVAEAARKLDNATGASRGANAVANAASVAAKEVDESWRVSERAREVVNDALRDDRIAPAARAIFGAVTPKQEGRRKAYAPSAERRNPDVVHENGMDDPSEALEF